VIADGQGQHLVIADARNHVIANAQNRSQHLVIANAQNRSQFRKIARARSRPLQSPAKSLARSLARSLAQMMIRQLCGFATSFCGQMQLPARYLHTS
jgi:hypothetical protein